MVRTEKKRVTIPRTRFAVAALVAVQLSTSAAAQDQSASITGRVTDGSGAALPGVTVTFTPATTGRAPVTAVTDGVGQYLSPPLPPGTYAVSFELSGFASAQRADVALRSRDVFLLDQQLGLASLTESVEVVARRAVPPAVPEGPPVKLEAPKRPEPVPVSREILASVCGPGRRGETSMSIGKLLAHRDEPNRRLYGTGDVLLLDVGADIGLVNGQNLVVRRTFRVGDKGDTRDRAAFGEQTAGLIQVVDAGPEAAVAVVVYTCGELFAGDVVEPFDALPVLSAKGLGSPAFESPARIVLGEHGQTLGATRALMVIDRGAAGGAERGQRLTIFRRALGDRGPVQAIADAVIIAVRPESATIRIERTSDAVSVGDLVALHR